jgi:hypothetical protein
MKKFLLILILSVVQELALAQDMYTVSKTDWIQEIQKEAPSKLCAEKSYFRSCFEVSTTKCQSLASQELRNCLKQVSLPSKIEALSVGPQMGRLLGKCVGKNMERQLASEKADESSCHVRGNQWQ